MNKKERFLQLLQTFLLATAPFRCATSAACVITGIMEAAQIIKEDCIPEEDLMEAIEEYVMHYDPWYCHNKLGHEYQGQSFPKPSWLQ